MVPHIYSSKRCAPIMYGFVSFKLRCLFTVYPPVLSASVSSQRALHRDASVKSEQWPRQGGQHAMRVYSMRSRGAVERFLRRTSYAGAEDIAGRSRYRHLSENRPAGRKVSFGVWGGREQPKSCVGLLLYLHSSCVSTMKSVPYGRAIGAVASR